MISKCPCKECVPPRRNMHCHASCQLYIDWKNEYDAYMKVVRDNEYFNRLGIPMKRRRK